MDEETLSSLPSSPFSSTSPSTTSTTLPSSATSALTTLLPSSTTLPTVPSDSSSSILHPSIDNNIISSTSQLPPHSSNSTGFIRSPDNPCSSYSYPRDCYVTAEAKINDIPGIVLLDT